MPVARWNAADHLDPGVSAACRTEPLLSSLGPGHLVEVPQRALRQPKRRQGVAPPPLIRMLGAGRQVAGAEQDFDGLIGSFGRSLWAKNRSLI